MSTKKRAKKPVKFLLEPRMQELEDKFKANKELQDNLLEQFNSEHKPNWVIDPDSDH